MQVTESPPVDAAKQMAASAEDIRNLLNKDQNLEEEDQVTMAIC